MDGYQCVVKLVRISEIKLKGRTFLTVPCHQKINIGLISFPKSSLIILKKNV